MLIVVLAMIPAFGLIIWTGIEHGGHLEDQLRADAVRQVESFAEIQQRLTSSSRQTMATVADILQRHRLPDDTIVPLLSSFLAQIPELLNISITDARGFVTHSAMLPPGVDFSARKHVRDAIATRSFAVGEYIEAKVDAIPSLAYALPVLDTDGSIESIILCAYRLDAYEAIFEQLELPAETILGLVDHAGVRLFFYPPKATNPIGQPIKGAIWQSILEGSDSGTILQTGSDNIKRFYAYSKLRLDRDQPVYMYIVLAVPEAVARRPSRLVLIRNLGFLLVLLLMSLGLAFVLGHVLVERRIQLLMEATSRIQAGQLDFRLHWPEDRSELTVVGHSIDRMAEALARQAEERSLAAAQLERSLREKETLLREIHHRVKNNLQLILSLIHLQEQQQVSLKEFSTCLEGRIQAMSLIHELLYQSEDFGGLDIGGYIRRLVSLQFQAASYLKAPELELTLESVWLNIDQAIPLALLFNELVSNALKHGRRDSPKLIVELTHDDDHFQLLIQDNGIGLPDDFDPLHGEGLGMKLVDALVQQLGGSFSWSNAGGARFCLRFTLNRNQQ